MNSMRGFFAGVLPKYTIQVVYDLVYWTGRAEDGNVEAAIDYGERTITICYTLSRYLPSILLHFMCHAVHPGSDDLDPRWLGEMDRLRELGAPILVEGPECPECGGTISINGGEHSHGSPH
jgi:hypothetical protein